MKISYTWLQKYFDTPLPSVEELSHAITFHAFEIEGTERVEGDIVLDVKVLPDRTHDCLSYRGVAKEVAAILNLPLASDPLKDIPVLEPKTPEIVVSVGNELCERYIAGFIKGVKVGPSPKWLQERLASMGQRSVNNVVDATNFIMFNIGQPLHAFDAAKLEKKEGAYAIEVRYANKGEQMIALDDKVYDLTETMLVIADANKGEAVGIAGIKGGKPAGISEETVNIIIESANFNGVSVRRTSTALKLRTDASTRFENVISPELAAYGMRSVVDLIVKLAGGEVVGFADVYAKPQSAFFVTTSAHEMNRIFGTTVTVDEMENLIKRLGVAYTKEREHFNIEAPFERLDMRITEDVVADVGRIYGYEHIPSVPLPSVVEPLQINKHFYYIDRIREWLAAQGFSEVYTSVFSLEGKRQVLNKVDSDRPYLRADIWPGLQAALEANFKNKELLGVSDVRLFEIGTVFTENEEKTMLVVGTMGGKGTPPGSEFVAGIIKEFDMKVPEIVPPTPLVQVDLDSLIVHAPDPLAYQKLPTLGDVRYTPFSRYPFSVRDVAFWCPAGTDADDVQQCIGEAAGTLATRIDSFDRFEKEGRVSYGFRIVFQASDRTLTEADTTPAMERVYEALRGRGYEIR